MVQHPKRTTLYLIAILAMYCLAGTSDYHEQRKLECTNRSTVKHFVEWDSTTDRCVRSIRNGQTPQNR